MPGSNPVSARAESLSAESDESFWPACETAIWYERVVVPSCAITSTWMVEVSPKAGTVSAGDWVPLATVADVPVPCVTVMDWVSKASAVGVILKLVEPNGTLSV